MTLAASPVRPNYSLWSLQIQNLSLKSQVSAQNIEDIVIMLRKIKDSLTVVFTEMCPSFFFEVTNINTIISLGTFSKSVVLCVSAIGSADAFVQTMQKVT